MQRCLNVLAAVIVVAVVTTGFAMSVRAQGSASAASVISKFVGSWKEDVSKRQIGSDPNLTFRSAAGGGIEELRGSELKPLVQPVHFTGKPYSVDGSTNTIAWKQIDAHAFERALYSDGKLINTRRIRLSADEQTLTQETEAVRPAGNVRNTVVFRRVAGEKGLVGRWRPSSTKTDTPPVFKYEAVGANGLKQTNTNNGQTQSVVLDNKPVPLTGPAVISGTMAAYRQVDASTIEVTTSREGIVTGKSVRKISADGKTMTVTTTTLGPNASKEPSVSVFVKQ